jgi:transcriptional regulator with XRE-family HTH domain
MGQFIKRARERLNMTPQEFGKHIGVTDHTVWRYERTGAVRDPMVLLTINLLRDHEVPKEEIERMKQ